MTPWWTRAGLEVRDQRLLFAGHDAERIAREHGTPLYVYDPERVTANVGRLRAAFVVFDAAPPRLSGSSRSPP